jgi:hypothetical protein
MTRPLGGRLSNLHRPDMKRTSGTKAAQPVQRTLLTRREAADSMGMSLRTFERRVQPDVRIVAVGQLRLVAPSELQRWADEHARDPIS